MAMDLGEYFFDDASSNSGLGDFNWVMNTPDEVNSWMGTAGNNWDDFDWAMNTPDEVNSWMGTAGNNWDDFGWAMNTPDEVNSWMGTAGNNWDDFDWAMNTPDEVNSWMGAPSGYPTSDEYLNPKYSLATGNSGLEVQLDDLLHPKGVNLDAMGGGYGATIAMPAKYYSEGTLDAEGNSIAGKEIPMSKGVLTALGMIPDRGASVALGDPDSWINNPNITGDRVVVAPNNLVTSRDAYRYDNQPSPLLGGGTPTFGTNTGLTLSTASGANPVKPEAGARTPLEKIVETVENTIGGGAGSGGAGSGGVGGAPGQQNQGSNWLQMLMMMLLLSQMNKGKSSSGASSAVIPQLTAKREQTPASTQRPAGYRPGQGGVTYFQPTQYAAAGGAMGAGIGGLGQYAAGGKGRLVSGTGDGVSDDIPATIDGVQPARIARGEYVIPARVVAELGNGSTDAGAERLDDMVSRIERAGRKADRGADSKAYHHIPT